MSRPQTRQLISGPLSSELELIEFLRPYKRVRNNSVCKMSLDASQVTVWIFKNGEWLRGMPKNTMKSGSWCQSYLTAMLKLSQAQYEVAKKEMFSSQDGLNGVYAHESKPKFALVYRPPQKWSNSTKAAIAGGAALVGLAGTTYALRSRPSGSQSAAKTSQPPDPYQEVDDKLTNIEADLDSRLKIQDSVPAVDGLDEHQAFLQTLSQMVLTKAISDRVFDISRKIEQVQYRHEVNIPMSNILKMLEPKSYNSIITSSDWSQVDKQFARSYEILDKYPNKRKRLMVARHFADVVVRAKDMSNADGYKKAIQDLLNVKQSQDEILKAVNELISMYKSPDILRPLYDARLKLDNDQLQHQAALKSLTPLTKEELNRRNAADLKRLKEHVRDHVDTFKSALDRNTDKPVSEILAVTTIREYYEHLTTILRLEKAPFGPNKMMQLERLSDRVRFLINYGKPEESLIQHIDVSPISARVDSSLWGMDGFIKYGCSFRKCAETHEDADKFCTMFRNFEAAKLFREIKQNTSVQKNVQLLAERIKTCAQSPTCPYAEAATALIAHFTLNNSKPWQKGALGKLQKLRPKTA
jgi:hypothetical protein